MRPISLIFIALVALIWSSAAAAESNTPTSTLDLAALSDLTDLNLDAAFERAASPISNSVLHGFGGPTTMNCTNCDGVNATEICVVHAEGVPASEPASLAQH